MALAGSGWRHGRKDPRDPRAPCLWAPAELWPEFIAAVDRRPNLIGAVIYRNKTIREGRPNTDITTRRY